jgi:hypothetical protein
MTLFSWYIPEPVPVTAPQVIPSADDLQELPFELVRYQRPASQEPFVVV